ncbi:MAG: DUF1045 domain-containing protein, partial [Caulobacterales bacterium]|nr:DUF1045 domain-containing protein [Caulobacterales bacterium]
MTSSAPPAGPRYAVYFAPAADSALWARASGWIGRDAGGGATPPRPAVMGLNGFDFDALTTGPRLYGFHATLRSPFHLAEGVGDGDVRAAARAVAQRLEPITVSLRVGVHGGFAALVPARPAPELQALHEQVMRGMDGVRAPLSVYDFKRRARGSGDREHDLLLQRWGYPHVFGRFRFHMALTNRIENKGKSRKIEMALAALF